MNHLRLALLPLLLGLLALTGCMGGVRIAGTSVTLISLSAAPDGGDPRMTLRIANENIFSLAIAETDHRLYLNGQYVGRAVSTVPIGLPQLSATERTVPVRIEKPEILKSLLGQKSVSYKLDTLVRMAVSEQDMKHSTSSTGQIDIPADLQAAGK